MIPDAQLGSACVIQGVVHALFRGANFAELFRLTITMSLFTKLVCEGNSKAAVSQH